MQLMEIFVLMALAAPETDAYQQALDTARRQAKVADYARAAASYDAALGARPKDATAMSGRGYVRMLSGRYDEARDDLGRARQWATTDKTRAMVDHNLGLVQQAVPSVGKTCGT